MIQAPHGSHRALKEIYDPSERNHRPNQIPQIECELYELASRYLSADDEAAAVPEHRDEAEPDEKLQDRMKDRGEPNEPHVAVDEFLIYLFEALNFRVLLRVRPYDSLALQGLLRSAGGGPEIFLHLRGLIMNP